MLRLMLLRHAKSDWTGSGVGDLERPLTRRGKSAAQAMGRAMRDRGLLPDLVLCSPARRARDTWDLVAEELKNAPKTLVEDSIYDFGNGGRLTDAIRQRGGKAKGLLLVGHNPSMERLALRLAVKGEKKLVERMEKKYPTGALSAFTIDVPAWSEFEEQEATLTHFIRPRDILAEKN